MAFLESNVTKEILTSGAENVTFISDGAFENCTNFCPAEGDTIERLLDLFDKNITAMGESCFRGTTLRSIAFPLKLTSWNDAGFWPSTIESVFLPGLTQLK